MLPHRGSILLILACSILSISADTTSRNAHVAVSHTPEHTTEQSARTIPDKKNTIPRKIGRALMGTMTGFVDSSLSAIVGYYMAGMSNMEIVPYITSACVASHISLGARRTCHTDLYFHIPHAISHMLCSANLYMSWEDIRSNTQAPQGYLAQARAWLRDPLQMLSSTYISSEFIDRMQNIHIFSNVCIAVHGLVDIADKELLP